MPRSKPIVAVFGSRNGTQLAADIGSKLSNRGCITLTGGRGTDDDRVKERAICGARPGPWIGVERNPPKRDTRPKDSGIIIYTDLGHARNYLEAHLCDAAICIKNGDGTTSELIFSFSLQRPVALVGDWMDPSTESELREMLDRAFTRVPNPPNGKSQIEKGLRKLPPFKSFELNDSAEEIVNWILQQIPPDGGLGTFPRLDGYGQVSQTYDVWTSTA